jgi:hypothetical protein
VKGPEIMSQFPNLRFEDALSVEIQTDRDTAEASFHFLTQRNGPLVVTIPLVELERLHAHIAYRLEKEPHLFAPVRAAREK